MTFEKTCFLYFRLINWNFCFVFIVKTMTMICVVVKSVIVCYLVVKKGLLMNQLVKCVI